MTFLAAAQKGEGIEATIVLENPRQPQALQLATGTPILPFWDASLKAASLCESTTEPC